MLARVKKVPHVVAPSPALYGQVLVSGPIQSHFAALKGVNIDDALAMTDALRHLKQGSVDSLRDPHADPPGIIIGTKLMEDAGLRVGIPIQVLTPQGELT